MKFKSLTAASVPEILLGRGSLTLGAGLGAGGFNITISQTKDSVLSNYRVFASVTSTGAGVAFINHATLTSQTNVQVAVQRITAAQTGASATGVSVDGQDLIDVDVTVSNPHGSDAGLAGHGHSSALSGNALHTVTDPTHTHASFNSGSSITITVDVMVIHI